MARINIEDSLYKDGRFIKLCIRLGSVETAIGALVRAWSVAQKFYVIDDRLIPYTEWQKQELNDALIEIGLAENLDGRIKISGADEQFKWLLQRVEAGRKGGVATARRSHSGRSAVEQPPTLTLTLTPSLALSSDSDSISENVCVKATDVALHPLAVIWNRHCGPLPKVVKLGKRTKRAESIWKEQSPEEWEKTVQKIAASSFCRGHGSTAWKATFDWILKPDTYLKVNEGKYDDGPKAARSTRQTQIYDNLDALEREWKEKR